VPPNENLLSLINEKSVCSMHASKSNMAEQNEKNLLT